MSYKREPLSTLLAQHIEVLLDRKGINTYVDISRAEAGLFPDRLYRAIEKADYFVCLLEANTLESEWVQEEIRHAHQHSKLMIPVFVNGHPPRHGDLDEHVRLLMEHEGVLITDMIHVRHAVDELVRLINAPIDPKSVSPSVLAPKPIARNRDWTKQFETFTEHSIDFEMCLVPPGSFMMGSEDYDREKPVHQQTITSPFWIGVHPVTNAQWRAAVAASNGIVKPPDRHYEYNDRNRDNEPVVGVTWFQCRDFVRWLGHRWQLPSEVEWEYVARGPDALVYPWGNEFRDNIIIYNGNSRQMAAPTGGRPDGASWVGAQDMAGNIREWTRTKWRRNYDNPPDDDMHGDSRRVLRGGSWYHSHNYARCASRQGLDPHFPYDDAGLRLVYAAPPR